MNQDRVEQFRRDGFLAIPRLVDTVTGWPGDVQADRLLQAFRAGGVEGAQ